MLSDFLIPCPNCKKRFYKESKEKAELHTVLSEKEAVYTYCSEKCLLVKISDINKNTGKFDMKIKIKNLTRISTSPIVWRADCEIAEFKLENIIG